jgi:hypothetical protein
MTKESMDYSPVAVLDENDPYDTIDRPSEIISPPSQLTKVLTILKRSLNVSSTFFLGMISNFITLYFAGHLTKQDEHDSTDTFAGISMSLLFANISAISLFIGMSGAVETLGNLYFEK